MTYIQMWPSHARCDVPLFFVTRQSHHPFPGPSTRLLRLKNPFHPQSTVHNVCPQDCKSILNHHEHSDTLPRNINPSSHTLQATHQSFLHHTRAHYKCIYNFSIRYVRSVCAKSQPFTSQSLRTTSRLFPSPCACH